MYLVSCKTPQPNPVVELPNTFVLSKERRKSVVFNDIKL